MKPGKIAVYIVTGLLVAARIWELWQMREQGKKRENVSPMFHPKKT